jgi:hypothetical protein
MSSLSRVEDRAIHGAGGYDEWDQLRATPDFDADEMQSVGLWLQPDPAVLAAPADDVWMAEPSPAFVPTEAMPWPEAASVASMVSDLFEVVSAPAPAGTGNGGGAAEPWGDEGSLFAGTAWQDDTAGAWDGGPAGYSPEMDDDGLGFTVSMAGEGDLLGVALEAGARAGLIDGGSSAPADGSPRNGWRRGHSRWPEAGVELPGEERGAAQGAAPPTAEGAPRAAVNEPQSGDLLDTALAAGERAGLMDRWGGGVQ